MPGPFQFEHSFPFVPERAVDDLRQLPPVPGVLCLRGTRETDEPYLTRTADLRRRAMRLLAPPEVTEGGETVLSKRLNLRDRVAHVEWSATGSELEALLALYHAVASAFGLPEARRRLRLHTPYCLRFTADHAHPRLYVTNRLSRRSFADIFGPFASRAAAERYSDAVLDLFKLRRCHEDLEPYPEHPGCVYGEMKKCLAPCNTGCTAGAYAAEAEAVHEFLETGGQSMLAPLEVEREQASAAMDFEHAADLHVQWNKVKAAAAVPGELVRELRKLRAVIVQPAASAGDLEGESNDRLEAALFLLEGGTLTGPERLSTLGVRAVKEQTSVGSSLFAQPLMLQAVPLDAAPGEAVIPDSPEERARRAIETLKAQASQISEPATVSDHLSILRRWFYRPEKQRKGEVFFPNPDGTWPVRRILRGAARMALGEPTTMAETNRDGVAAAKVKILHEGRADVERTVPVVSRRKKKPVVQAMPPSADSLPGA